MKTRTEEICCRQIVLVGNTVLSVDSRSGKPTIEIHDDDYIFMEKGDKFILASRFGDLEYVVPKSSVLLIKKRVERVDTFDCF